MARLFSAAGEEHGVERVVQRGERLGYADVDPAMEHHAFRFHLPNATVDMVLFHLEIRDAVAEQPAGFRLALEHMHRMPGPRELLGRGKACWTRTNDGNTLAGLCFRRLRDDPAHLPGLVGDGLLDGLNGDGLVFEVEGAGLLARGRADAARELREVVGGVQVARRLEPVVLEHEVVPIRNLVVHRAAGRAVAERNAAIHAARRLLAQIAGVERQRELAKVADAFARELVLLLLTVVLQKSRDLAHYPDPASWPGATGPLRSMARKAPSSLRASGLARGADRAAPLRITPPPATSVPVPSPGGRGDTRPA